MVAFWVSIIFTSCELFAPRNGTAITALFVCAVSAPMHEALAYVSQ
jgi:hypothetical protein